MDKQLTLETAQGLAQALHNMEEGRTALVTSTTDQAPELAFAYMEARAASTPAFEAAQREYDLLIAGVDTPGAPAEAPPGEPLPEPTSDLPPGPGEAPVTDVGSGEQPAETPAAPEEGSTITKYDRENLPADDAGWREFRKISLTRAVKIEGPFAVQVDGDPGNTISIEDGYLAIDARGYPYPIAAEEFELIYEEAVEPVLGEQLTSVRRQLDALDDDPKASALVAAIDQYIAETARPGEVAPPAEEA